MPRRPGGRAVHVACATAPERAAMQPGRADSEVPRSRAENAPDAEDLARAVGVRARRDRVGHEEHALAWADVGNVYAQRVGAGGRARTDHSARAIEEVDRDQCVDDRPAGSGSQCERRPRSSCHRGRRAAPPPRCAAGGQRSGVPARSMAAGVEVAMGTSASDGSNPFAAAPSRARSRHDRDAATSRSVRGIQRLNRTRRRGTPPSPPRAVARRRALFRRSRRDGRRG